MAIYMEKYMHTFWFHFFKHIFTHSTLSAWHRPQTIDSSSSSSGSNHGDEIYRLIVGRTYKRVLSIPYQPFSFSPAHTNSLSFHFHLHIFCRLCIRCAQTRSFAVKYNTSTFPFHFCWSNFFLGYSISLSLTPIASHSVFCQCHLNLKSNWCCLHVPLSLPLSPCMGMCSWRHHSFTQFLLDLNAYLNLCYNILFVA